MFFLAVIDAIQILDDDDDDDDDEYYFRFMFNYFNVFGDHFSLGRVIPGGPGLPNKKLWCEFFLPARCPSVIQRTTSAVPVRK